ncbi:MAG: OmpA family protein [Verrucomicrobiales bacterium]|nr:OmpA family protein [Verrucomicrobiales bacterium]
MAAEYDWHPRTQGGGSVFKVETRNLGWWIVLAVLVSVVVHILLYFLLSKWEHKPEPKGPLEFRLQTKQETIDRSELEKLLSEEPKLPDNLDVVEPENLSNMDMTQDIDDFDLMDMLKDEPVRMAPADFAELGRSAPPPQVPSQALDMAANAIDLASAEILSNDLQDMRKKLIDSSNQVAAEQPVLEIDSTNEDSKGVNTDEFFKDAAKKVMGNKADEFVKGYASLDDLISQTGGIRRGTSMTAIMPSDILFGFNESELKDVAKITMIKLAYLIETNPDATFIIEGHTDSIGPEEANLILSQRRAQAVKNWLVRELRINPANIQVVGTGESEPIAPVTGIEAEEALNRRVEIEIRRR